MARRKQGPRKVEYRPGMRTRVLYGSAALPLLCILLCMLFASACPEQLVWSSAAKAVLLTLPRWLVLLWVPWGLWAAWNRSPGGLPVAAVAVVASGWPTPADDEGLGLQFIVANVQAYSDEPEVLEAAIAGMGPDIVIAIEQRVRKLKGMDRVAHNYDRDLPRPSHGTAVFCRKGLLCSAEVTGEIGPEDCSMPLTLVQVEAQLCVVGIHAPPPAPICGNGLQPYVEHVAHHVDDGRVSREFGPCAVGDPVLVAGDLNQVPGSRAWRTLVDTGLEDQLAWHGIWAASWPNGGGWPKMPFFRLDQVLAGPMDVGPVDLVDLPGADHRALRFRVSSAG